MSRSRTTRMVSVILILAIIIAVFPATAWGSGADEMEDFVDQVAQLEEQRETPSSRTPGEIADLEAACTHWSQVVDFFGVANIDPVRVPFFTGYTWYQLEKRFSEETDVVALVPFYANGAQIPRADRMSARVEAGQHFMAVRSSGNVGAYDLVLEGAPPDDPVPEMWPTLYKDRMLTIEERGGQSYLYGVRAAAEPLTVGQIQRRFLCVDGTSMTVFSRSAGSDEVHEVDPQAVYCTGLEFELTSTRGNKRTLTSIVMGDVLGNGKLAINQLTRLARAVNGSSPLEGAYLLAGDFAGTGSISIADLVAEAKLLTADQPPIGTAISVAGIEEAVYLMARYEYYYDRYQDGRMAMLSSVVESLTDLWQMRQLTAEGYWTHMPTLLEPSFPLSPQIEAALDSAVVGLYGQPGFTYDAVYTVLELLTVESLPDLGSADWNMIVYYLEHADRYERILYTGGYLRCGYEWFGTPYLQFTYRGPEPFQPGLRKYGVELTSMELDTPVEHDYFILTVAPNEEAPLGFYVMTIYREYAGSTWPDSFDGGYLPPLKPFPYDKL